jgi:hypothetical protein
VGGICIQHESSVEIDNRVQAFRRTAEHRENHVVVNIDDWMFPMVSDSGADRRGYIELSFAKVKNQFCILEIIFPARIERLSERK